jgi:hypothetical protein
MSDQKKRCIRLCKLEVLVEVLLLLVSFVSRVLDHS